MFQGKGVLRSGFFRIRVFQDWGVFRSGFFRVRVFRCLRVRIF